MQAKNAPQKNFIMCGVRFMAETVKILSPDKKVLLSHPDAACPMAEQLAVSELKKLKSQHPDAATVAYINTTAALKCECDVCVTSASALDIVKKLPQKEILFIPDCNLGSWIAKHVPEKDFIFVNGGCPVHTSVTVDDVISAKQKHTNALLLVHPECVKEVTEMSDFAGSTTAIMDYAKNSDAKEFIIGTENSIVQHLQFDNPDKAFYPLSKGCICTDMRLTTLVDVYNAILGTGGEVIDLPEDVIVNARKSIDRMLTI